MRVSHESYSSLVEKRIQLEIETYENLGGESIE